MTKIIFVLVIFLLAALMSIGIYITVYIYIPNVMNEKIANCTVIGCSVHDSKCRNRESSYVCYESTILLGIKIDNKYYTKKYSAAMNTKHDAESYCLKNDNSTVSCYYQPDNIDNTLSIDKYYAVNWLLCTIIIIFGCVINLIIYTVIIVKKGYDFNIEKSKHDRRNEKYYGRGKDEEDEDFYRPVGNPRDRPVESPRDIIVDSSDDDYY